ncbi:nitrate- and nitrite sensing domain-containing protein [Dactylosporangium sp. NPDC051485]|uniref:sensor histidine kinase n=1 Tax=Dactylosporangium sp. NPDC051485 TaxID=3154846 RepID=UPI00341888BF
MTAPRQGSASTPVRRRWLRNRLIRTKLTIILATPIAAILILAGVVGYEGVADGQRAEQARQVVSLGGDAAVLVGRLHHERAGSALVFASAPGDERVLAEYRRSVLATDAAAATFRQHSGTVRVSADVRVVLDRADDGLEDLAALRQQVQADPKAVSSVVLFRYRALIADLLTFRQALSQIGVPAATGNELRAAAALSQAIEAQGLLQVAVVRAAAAGELTPAAQQEIVGASSSYADALVDFQLLAPPVWRTALNARVNGGAVLQAEREQGIVTRTAPGERLRLTTDVAGWSAAMGARMDLLHEVEATADRQILAEVTAQRDSARRAAVAVAGMVLAGLLLTVMIGAGFAVSLSRSLTRLRYEAADVATVRLPDLVARIDVHHADAATVAGLVSQAASPIPVDGNDEVGQVAAAFNAVAAAAARLASGQASARASVAAILASLAWRLKRQSDALTVALDEMQQNQTDPELLKGLFRLDHAATGFRRFITSLLVLTDQHAGRRQQPVPLPDVLRASTQGIEHYTRVEQHTVDPDVLIVGLAAEELVHLLTEFLDNATKYSPPTAPVTLEAARVGDHVHIHISDAGVGMSPDELGRLRSRFDRAGLDEAMTRQMGIPVAAAIATRLGIEVKFRSEVGRGTRIDVTIPQGLFQIQQRPALPALGPVDAPTASNAQTQELRTVSQGPAGLAWPPMAGGAGDVRSATAMPVDTQRPLIYDQLRPLEPPPYTAGPPVQISDLAATEAGLPVRQPGRHHRREPADGHEPAAALTVPGRRDPSHTRLQLAGWQRNRAGASRDTSTAHLTEAPR